MAKLPTRESLGGLPSARTGRVMARIDPQVPKSSVKELHGLVRDYQSVAGSMVRGLESVGRFTDTIQNQALKQQQYDTELKFQDFAWNQQRQLDERMRSVKPGEAGSFANTFQQDYVDRATEFYKNVPDALKPAYERRLFETERKLYDEADVFGRKEQKRFSIGTISDTVDNIYLPRARTTSTENLDNVTSDFERIVQSNPDLTPIEKDELLRKGRRSIGLAHIDSLPPERAGEALSRGQSGEVATDDLLRRFEGFRSGAYWDVNAYRTGYGSDTVTLEDGTVVPVTKDTKITREDAERDLARRINEFSTIAKNQVGDDAWNSLPTNARSALTSVAYNYGELPNSVVQAIESGDTEAVAQAVERLTANSERRKKEASIIRGSSGIYPEALTALTDDDRVKLKSIIERRQSVRQRMYLSEIEDYRAFLMDGGEPQPGKYSTGNIYANLPTDVASKVAGQLKDAESFGKAMSKVKFATPQELSELLEKERSDLASPEQYKQERAEVSTLERAIKRRNDLLEKDPAKYVMDNEVVQSSAAAINEAAKGNDPEAIKEATARYAEASIDAQTRLGVPPEDVRLLTKEMRASVARQFMTTEKGQNAATVMRTLSGQWGKNWPRVFGEMSKELPGAALVVGAMNRPDQSLAAETLAESLKVGRKELEKAHAEEDLKQLKSDIRSNMAPFGRTLAANVGGERTFNTFFDGAYVLALSYITRGDAPSDAASRAVTDIIDKKYEIVDTYRVPKELDADRISAGTATALGNLDTFNFDIPVSLSGLRGEDVKAAYIRALQTNGIWVTAPDESGLVLIDGSERRAVQINGKPFIFTWDYLTRSATAPPMVGGDQP